MSDSDQKVRIDYPRANPHLYGQLIFDKELENKKWNKKRNGIKTASSNRWFWDRQLDNHM